MSSPSTRMCHFFLNFSNFSGGKDWKYLGGRHLQKKPTKVDVRDLLQCNTIPQVLRVQPTTTERTVGKVCSFQLSLPPIPSHLQSWVLLGVIVC